MNLYFLKASVVCVCVLAIAGCNSGPDVASIVGENNQHNSQKVANALGLYQVRIGKPAVSEEALCEFIATNSTIDRNLEFMKIDRSNFRDHLIGERDSEPFVVRYGVRVPDRAPPMPLVLEATGVEGVRQVTWSNAEITEVSDEKEFQRLKSGKHKKEKPVDAQGEASKAAAEAAGHVSN